MHRASVSGGHYTIVVVVVTVGVSRFGGLAVLVGGLLAAGVTVAGAREPAPCTPRVLVLSAFPAEIDPIIEAAQLDQRQTVTIDGRHFYVGTLRGHAVVLALTGIGMTNATAVTQAAFEHFRCGEREGIRGVAFSGVAGGRFIGDVTIPTRWTADGTTWLPVDPTMLAAAQTVAQSGSVTLARDAPLGDPACLCLDADATLVPLDRQPEIVVGGDGFSSDPFGGRAFPCVPFGGDVLGCEPCSVNADAPPDLGRLASGLVPFVDPEFFLSYLQSPPAVDPAYVAQDMETAASALVAAQHAVPFIAFRAVSDGDGDPLMLPGFPSQFLVYRVLAAENAAAVTLGFLDAWAEAG